MKRTIAILMICVLLVSLVGCTTLGQVRSNHAFWTNEAGSGLILDGVEYRALTSAYGDFQPLTDDTRWVYATAADVPALLKDMPMVGAIVDISADGRFIYGKPANMSESSIYCRADCYDEMKARIARGFTPEGYCYEYYNDEGITELYQLSDAEAAVIDEILSVESVLEIPYDKLSEYSVHGGIQVCSKDLLFRKRGVEVISQNDTYYLSSYVYYNRGELSAYQLYEAKPEQIEMLKSILRHEPKDDWLGTAHTF